MSDALLADLIVAIHLGYVAFVVVGELLIVIGIWRRWRWVRNRWFRLLHLIAILIVAGEAILNITCPLTAWEAALRERAGQSVETGTFIGKLIHNMLFINAPDWAFNLSYVLFAALVAFTFWWVPPVWKPHATSGSRPIVPPEQGLAD